MWKRALERFRQHEASKCHQLAVRALATSRGPCAAATLSAVGKEREQSEARHALRRIFDAVVFCSKQGLALRRHEEEHGNVIQYMKSVAQTDPIVAAWLARRSVGRLHYTSPSAQAEIQKQLALTVTRQVVAEVRSAPYFGLILDETTDVTRREQMAICLRYVTKDLEVRETCVGLYQTDSTTAEDLFHLVQDALARTQLPMKNIRGQCYDGAANMAGSIRGLQVRVKAVEPRAIFIHCTAHRLNLVVREALDGVREVRDVVQEVSRLVHFFRESPKRLAIFKNAGAQNSLRPLCPTRWTCSEDCLASLLGSYAETLSSLEEIAGDRSTRPDVASTASGFAKNLQQFEFLFGLKLALLLLEPVTPAMKSVQGGSQSVAANISLVRSVREVILSQRSCFPRFWADVTSSAEKLDLEEPRLRRQRRPPRRLDDGGEPHQPTTPEDHYRRVFTEAVDWTAGAMAGRFPSDETVLATAERALLTAEEDAVAETARFYQVDEDRLRLHTRMLGDVARERGAPLTSLSDAVSILREGSLQEVLPAATDLLRSILTAPATSCEAERTFSQLRHIKNWLRSSLSQERLNHALMLAVHREQIEAVDIYEEMRAFAAQTAQRTNTFGRW